MRAQGAKTEIILPFGLADGRGRRQKSAVLIPLDGHAELVGAEDPNPFRAALRLLSASITRLGPFGREDMDLALLSSLLPIDRDVLLVALTRLSFGDIRFQTVVCPAEGCGKRLDIRLDLSSLSAPDLSMAARGRLVLPDKRSLRFRLPTAGDQIALHGLAAEALESAFLERCIEVDPEDETCLSPEVALALPEDLRAELVGRVLSASPELDTQLELSCAECEHPFRFVYDPVTTLLGDLRASRAVLLKEIHYLAYHYHWGHTEILALPRGLRREYLTLLDDELSARRAGVLR